MPTYTDSRAGSAKFNSDHGNAYTDDGVVTLPVGFTTTDKARLVQIPAGVRLTGLRLRNTDLDSGTTVTANLGFEPASNTGTPAANATYFASASTVLRAAAMTDFNFDPIVFNEPVWITLIPAAGPTTTAGTVSAIVYGEMVGAK